MPRSRHYDPIVEAPRLVEPAPEPLGQPQQMRGFVLERPGTYVLLEDIVAALYLYADPMSNEINEDDSNVVHAAADWLSAGIEPVQDPGRPSPETEEALRPIEQFGPVVERVELYPDENGKWHTRSISPDGLILKVTSGDFNKGYVERDAGERWPGITIYEVQNESDDSTRPNNTYFGPSARIRQNKLG